MSSSWYFTYTKKNPLLNDCYRRIPLDFGHIAQCHSEKISSSAILLTFKREFRASFFLEELGIFLLIEKEK